MKLAVPVDHKLGGFRKLMQVKGITVTLVSTTFPSHKHVEDRAMRPRARQRLVHGVDMQDGEAPLIFVHPSLWTYEGEVEGSVLATKSLPGGQNATVYRIEHEVQANQRQFDDVIRRSAEDRLYRTMEKTD